MKRAIFYIDVYNLYHAIQGLGNPRLKWLDLFALAKVVSYSLTEEVVEVKLFTAIAHHHHDQGKAVRHRLYLDALAIQGVTYKLGFFNESNVTCRRCNHSWPKHEEKKTDTALSVEIVADAYDDLFDVGYVISCDADMAPALELVRNKFGDTKEVVSVAPPGMRHSAELKKFAHSTRKISAETLARCLLPAQLEAIDGRIIRRPASYA